MQVEHRQGNLFDTDILHIVHGCNAQGVMGSGVARIVRDEYPEAYEEYVRAYKEGADGMSFTEMLFTKSSGLPMGMIQMVPSNGKVIINAITQEQFGPAPTRWVSYDAVADAFRSINKALAGQATQVAMPRIGAGLGGGDWNVIEAIIASEMTQVQPVVYTP